MFANLILATTLLTTYQETLYPEWSQNFSIQEMIHEEKSDFWDLAIFENSRFGRILVIDGRIQLTERDEFVYHEMMAHVPILAHGSVKNVLIVGGGDGGTLREVLRHEGVEKAVLVEIDPSVIELSKKYLPGVSQGAFEDPRAEIVIQDSSKYVKETTDRFDVIICDSGDPEGPASVLFTSEYYGDCKKLLNPDGIFINQNGVPFMQKSELQLTRDNRAPHFKHVTFYIAPVPTYVGGFMAFGWASDKEYDISETTLRKGLEKVDRKMRYYTPSIHKACFALPQYMLD